jgi:hypothetical protein
MIKDLHVIQSPFHEHCARKCEIGMSSINGLPRSSESSELGLAQASEVTKAKVNSSVIRLILETISDVVDKPKCHYIEYPSTDR